MDKNVFTVTEVSKIIKISTVTVQRLLKNKKIKGFRPSENAHWKISRKELIKYMKEYNIPFEFLQSEKIKILVIDDEVNVTRMIKKTLKDIDKFKIETANSGFIAGTKLESFKPDVIVLDIFLGDMDGRDFFDHIQHHPELNNTKVIGITGILDQNEIQPLLDKGFSTFLLKPFTMNLLKETILNVFENQI